MSSASLEWVVDWLSPERYSKYLRAAGGDPRRALELYEWNSLVAEALLHDLGHLEIGLRNAYDRALLSLPASAGRDWIDPDVAIDLFPRDVPPGRTGTTKDKNETPRNQIKRARASVGFTDGSSHRGKVIAEISFGFWTYLSDSLHEKTLWVNGLSTIYGPAADRMKINEALRNLRTVRNRIAHHESVFDQNPENVRRRIVFIASRLSPALSGYISSNSRVGSILATRP